MTVFRSMSRPLSLYRSILRFHRQKLPIEMRKLGDDYVKHEFRQHKQTTNQTQLNDFFTEWERYLKMMKQQSAGKFGRELEKSEASKLNDEQRIKLAQLREETKAI